MFQLKPLSIIGSSWLSVARLFFTKEAKIFFLVVLKTIMRIYSLFFKHCWALIIFYLILEFLYYSPIRIPLFNMNDVCSFAWFALVFLLCLIARPSVPRKDFNYYKNHFIHMFVFVLCLTGLLKYTNEFIAWNCSLLFFVFFWIDSGRLIPRFKVFYRTIYFIISVFPFCFLYMFLFHRLYYFIVQQSLGFGIFFPLVMKIFVLLLLPIQLSLIISLYVKMVYNSYVHYYKK